MTCQPFNIKVVEDNSFALLMPLKKRTYVSNVPVDEDINALELTDVTLKIGDTEYTPELGTDGVRVVMPDGLTRGTYNVILRAKYRGSDITAAYFEAITAVQWNYQSDAEQYVQGSPIVFEAAYVIGGALTDAELVALKAALRAAIAAAEAAEAAAQAAKQAFDEKAEAITGVAQEVTSQQILYAISHIDFTQLAKQGSNPDATNTAILAAFGQIDFSQLAKQGLNPNISLTSINELLGSMVMMTEAELQPALDDLDDMLDALDD